jgi:hypothetical protein
LSSRDPHRWTLAIRLGAVSLLLVVGAVVGRVWAEGRSELEMAISEQAKGNRVGAQKHFLYAARWYLPLTSTTSDAVEALLTLGEQWEKEEAWQQAVGCFDDARGALYATAWLPGPDDQLMGRADAGYARALAAWKKSENPDVDIAAETERYMAIASSVEAVSPWWSLLMGLSFLGYVIALFVIAWRWERPTFRRWVWCGGGAVSFALWILSMTLV